MLEEAEMSQVVNGLLPHLNVPIGRATLFLRQNVAKAVARKTTHKEVRVFVQDKLKPASNHV
jgi:hypothetical protein